jgi:hypothetical protein
VFAMKALKEMDLNASTLTSVPSILTCALTASASTTLEATGASVTWALLPGTERHHAQTSTNVTCSRTCVSMVTVTTWTATSSVPAPLDTD